MTGPRFLAGIAVVIFLLEGTWFSTRDSVLPVIKTAFDGVLSWLEPLLPPEKQPTEAKDEGPEAALPKDPAEEGTTAKPAEEGNKKEEAKKEEAKKEPAERTKAVTKQEEPLKPLPPKDLPPQTRPKPDPQKTQFLREPVFVHVEERAKPSVGEAFTPKVPVVENYLQEYLRRAGHPVVSRQEDASYRVEGNVQAEFNKKLIVLGRVEGYKYGGSSAVRVLASDGQELEKFEIPQVFQASSRSEQDALLQFERYMAKVVWENLFGRGAVLGNPKVVSLVSALAIEGPPPAPDAVDTEPLTTETIISSLVGMGLEAVPYLLDALTDDRIVRIESKYPGLKGRNLDDLRIYHIADKALEEIFQKVSRMNLDTSEVQRVRLVLPGWESEWRRFCKPFRESPRRKESAPEAKKDKNGSAPEAKK